MTVTVIIPTYERPKSLEMVFVSYLNQKYVTEIIVIDDGSTCDYKSVSKKISQCAENRNIKYIYHKNIANKGAAYCRNMGVRMAGGDYILWGEDDAFLSDNYISVLANKSSSQSICFGSIYYGVTPWATEEEKNKLIKEQQEADFPIFDFNIFECFYRKTVQNDLPVPFGHALILVPRKAYEGIKYYEDYKVNGYREESDAQVQMLEKGYQILYTSETECYHFSNCSSSKSGQHRGNIFREEWYKFVNTCIFYNRHYKYLKKAFDLAKSLSHMKMYYLWFLFKRNLSKIVRKIKR